MEPDQKMQIRFLKELYTVTDGESSGQASMYEIGEKIGLERADAGALAEDLMVEGLVELKTLSGAISITPEGLRLIDRGTEAASAASVKLGNDRLVGEEALKAIERMVGEIQAAVVDAPVSVGELEPLVIDLKTIGVYLLSPSPRSAVVRELLSSLGDCLLGIGKQDIHRRIESILG